MRIFSTISTPKAKRIHSVTRARVTDSVLGAVRAAWAGGGEGGGGGDSLAAVGNLKDQYAHVS